MEKKEIKKNGKEINIYDWKKIYLEKILAISEKQSNLEVKQMIIENYKRIEFI